MDIDPPCGFLFFPWRVEHHKRGRRNQTDVVKSGMLIIHSQLCQGRHLTSQFIYSHFQQLSNLKNEVLSMFRSVICFTPWLFSGPRRERTRRPLFDYKEFANNLCVFITLSSLSLLLRPLGSSKLFVLHMPYVGKADMRRLLIFQATQSLELFALLYK